MTLDRLFGHVVKDTLLRYSCGSTSLLSYAKSMLYVVYVLLVELTSLLASGNNNGCYTGKGCMPVKELLPFCSVCGQKG